MPPYLLCKTTTWYDMKTLYLCVSDSHTFTLRGPRVTESERRVVRPELMRRAEGKPRVPVVQLTIDLQSDLLFELQTLPTRNPSPTAERQILHGCFFYSWLGTAFIFCPSSTSLSHLGPRCVFIFIQSSALASACPRTIFLGAGSRFA